MREGTDGGTVLYSTQIMGGGSTPSVLRSALSDFLADVRNRDDVITFLSMKRRAGKRRSSISEDQATNGALVRCVPERNRKSGGNTKGAQGNVRRAITSMFGGEEIAACGSQKMRHRKGREEEIGENSWN